MKRKASFSKCGKLSARKQNDLAWLLFDQTKSEMAWMLPENGFDSRAFFIPLLFAEEKAETFQLEWLPCKRCQSFFGRHLSCPFSPKVSVGLSWFFIHKKSVKCFYKKKFKQGNRFLKVKTLVYGNIKILLNFVK